MTYIENVFICMASPLLIAALCMGKRQTKFFLFCLAGMGACLLSAYINTFFAALYGADNLAATAEIAPVVEEVMKLLPLLFYLLVFEPKAEQIRITAVMVALSFATFENICYLIQNGAGHFSFIFFRGIGTGAMHVICGAIVGGGLAYVWQRTWLKIAGTCGLLGAAITFHALYNLLIAYGGAVQYAAYVLPVVILAAGKLIARRLNRIMRYGEYETVTAAEAEKIRAEAIAARDAAKTAKIAEAKAEREAAAKTAAPAAPDAKEAADTKETKPAKSRAAKATGAAAAEAAEKKEAN